MLVNVDIGLFTTRCTFLEPSKSAFQHLIIDIITYSGNERQQEFIVFSVSTSQSVKQRFSVKQAQSMPCVLALWKRGSYKHWWISLLEPWEIHWHWCSSIIVTELCQKNVVSFIWKSCLARIFLKSEKKSERHKGRVKINPYNLSTEIKL